MSEPSSELLVGNAGAQMSKLADNSVHVIVTSPPYYRLRDYGTEPQEWGGDQGCEHSFGEATIQRDTRGTAGTGLAGGPQWEARRFDRNLGSFCSCGAWRGELGWEPTVELFVEHLVEVFEEARRVLRPDGVMFLNLGDTYGTDGGSYDDAGSRGESSKVRSMVAPTDARNHDTRPKDLAGVPWRVAFALQAAGWWLRNDNVWAKTNPMPSSVTDRSTTSHEYVFMLSKSERYFYDVEAVKEGGSNGELWDLGDGWTIGRQARTVWSIATESFPGAHFAVMAAKVAERCVRAGTSEKGCCAGCGAPVVRVVERRTLNRNELPRDHPEWRPGRYDAGKAGDARSPGAGQRFTATRTAGWEPSCECGLPVVPCTVLDPFGGALTTAIVARRLGRACISVELGEEAASIGLGRMQTWWKETQRSRPIPDGQLDLLAATGGS